MLKRRYGIILIMIALFLCGSKPQSISHGDPLMTNLPFSAESISGIADSMSAAKLNGFEAEIRRLLDKDSSMISAYHTLKKQLAQAQKLGALGLLFRIFSESPGFNRARFDTAECIGLAQLWVRDALALDDEGLRMYYSDYLPQIKEPVYAHLGEWNFYPENTMIRPGKNLVVQYGRYYFYDRKKAKKRAFALEISRLTLDATFKPKGFTRVRTDTLRVTGEWARHEVNIAKPGVYRAVIFDDYHFQQFYFQATWLDGVIKTDRNAMLVFGASYRDTLPPPYRVFCIAADGSVFQTQTDGGGLCMMSHRMSDTTAGGDIRVIVAKNDQCAFLSGRFGKTSADTSLLYYLYTDRPIYRPGHTVHFRGMVMDFAGDRQLGPAYVDSFSLMIRDPAGNEACLKTLSVDKWGHFGDSLTLLETAKQGSYTMYNADEYHGRLTRRHRPMVAYHAATFIVEAYKKPEFTITATAGKDVCLTDEPVNVAIKGAYFFGGPLAGVPVTIRWYRENMGHYFSWWGGFERCCFYPAGGRTFIKQEELNFDADGACAMTWKGTPFDGEYTYLIAEAIVTDASRRQVRAEAQVKMVKHDAYISITPDKWEYEIGEVARVEVIAVDLKGDPLAGAVELRITKGLEMLDTRKLPIDKNGRVITSLKMAEPGEYRLEASAKDSRGKTLVVEQSLRCVKKRIYRWDWERIEITADKQRYCAGDTALITVKAGADSTRALCVVEGGRMFAHAVKRLSDHALEYRIPITPDLGYNVAFYAAFAGRDRLAYSSHALTIVDSTVLLSVAMKGNRTMRPGDAFDGLIVVKDRSGRPVEADFSVALVDEAIFAVAANSPAVNHASYSYNGLRGSRTASVLDMLPAYYRNRVATDYNHFDWPYLAALMGIAENEGIGYLEGYGGGGLSDKLQALEMGAGGFGAQRLERKASAPVASRGVLGMLSGGSMPEEKAVEPQPPRERTEFKDLGYWAPAIATSRNGEAPVRFTMPDDLTKWRLVLKGSDGRAYLLDWCDSLITRQDVMVKLEAPRSFTAGDSAVINSVIHNYSDAGVSATVNLEIKEGARCASLCGSGKQTLRIEKNGTARADWPVRITNGGTVTFYTSVYTPKGNDAESRTYPVLFHGIPRTIAQSGVLDEKNAVDTVTIVSPENTAPGSRILAIEYAPTLAYSLFQSLAYLTGYPYGCVEQTMSRFLPNLYVASVMKKLGIRDDSLSAMIPKYTSDGLARLQTFQHSDGGWGWWENDKTDPRMTALVAYGLAFAAGFNLPSSDRALAQALLERAVPSVISQMKAHKNDPNVAINLAYSLLSTRYASEISESVMSTHGKRTKLSSYGLSLLAECLYSLKKQAEVREIIDLLVSKAETSAGAAYWADNSGYAWYRQDEEATARALHALLICAPDNPLIPKAVMWLSRQKQNGFWVCTKTTAAVIHALSAYIEKSNEFNPDYAGEIRLNGKILVRFPVTKKSLDNWQGRIALSDSSLAGSNSLIISMNGKGRLYYSVRLQYATAEEPIKAVSAGLEVKRRYTKLAYAKDKHGEWSVERRDFDGKLNVGDEIEVQVAVNANTACEHMLLEDYFPSGMEVVNKPQEWYDRWCGFWYWGYTHKEARDDRMAFFLDHVNKGEQTFRYILRAETPGKKHSLPARAELMYDPEVNGNSEEAKVEIKD